MRKFLISLMVIALSVAVLAGGLSLLGANRLASAPAITTASIRIPTDPETLERGRHLANALTGCTDCHGVDLSGKVADHAPPGALLVAPNITPGRGSSVDGYTVDMWLRAVVHGIGGDGRSLVVMPSNYYADMPADEIGALIGYLQTLPPVDNELPETDLGWLGNLLLGVLDYSNLPINKIDHGAVGTAVTNEVPGELDGAYLAAISGCNSCHGAKLAGLLSETGPPPGPNLTTVEWTVEQFRHAIDTGERPDGTMMNVIMPWQTLRNMTNAETAAIWNHILEQPERVSGNND
jgi:cytochrome c553